MSAPAPPAPKGKNPKQPKSAAPAPAPAAGSAPNFASAAAKGAAKAPAKQHAPAASSSAAPASHAHADSQDNHAGAHHGGGGRGGNNRQGGGGGGQGGAQGGQRRPPRELPKVLKDKREAALKPLKEKVDKVNSDIVKVETHIRELRQKQNEVRQKFRETNSVLDGHNKQIQSAYLVKNKLGDDLDALKTKQVALRKEIFIQGDSYNLKHQKEKAADFVAKNLAELDAEIKRLEKVQMTVSMTKDEDKRQAQKIAEMKKIRIQLKDREKLAKDLESTDAAIADIKNQINVHKDSITKLKAERDALRPPEEREKAKQNKEKGAPSPVAELHSQIEAAQKKLTDLTESYNKYADEYNAKMDELKKEEREFFAKQREEEQLKWEQQKQRRDEQFAERRAKKAAWEAEQAKMDPYENDVAACNNLVVFLEPLAKELEKPATPTASPATEKKEEGGIKTQPDRKQKGGGAGGAKRQAKPEDKLRPFGFHHLAAFEKLSVPIPGKMGDLPQTLTALREKKAKLVALQAEWEKEQKAKEAAEAAAAAAAATPAAATSAAAAAPADAAATSVPPAAQKPEKEEGEISVVHDE